MSFANAKLSWQISNSKSKMNYVSGPILFTHFGLSGPAVFALSAHTAFEQITEEKPLRIRLVPEAAKDYQYWDQSLQNSFAASGSKQLLNILAQELPQKFASEILMLLNISEKKKAAEVTKVERQQISRLLSGELELTLTQRRPGEEFVTAGGVSQQEIDRKTMQSKICPGLYFAGEILDVDGLTGGFNLQAAWVTGWLAGKLL